MSPYTIDRESERKTHSDVVVGLIVAAAAALMTTYGVVLIVRLIVQWFARPF